MTSDTIPTALRIVHLSDPHLACAPSFSQYNMKRFFGRLNWLCNRAHKHNRIQFEATVRAVLTERPDIVILTGDIGQMGLPQEFELAEQMLRPLTEADIPILLINGNHDCYGHDPESDTAFSIVQRRLALNCQPDANGLLRIGDVEILLFNQAQIIPLFASGGWLKENTLETLDAVLSERPAPPLRIAAGHYPLQTDSGRPLPALCGLREADVFQQFLARWNVSCYLCGHIHHIFERELFDGCKQYCAGSATIETTFRRISIQGNSIIQERIPTKATEQ